MEDPSLKLEKESSNLQMLRDKVDKCGNLSKGMCSVLTSFDEHLMKLEQTILPVYMETGNLQRRQENIDKILERLDYVIQHYNVPKDVDSSIRAGPSGCLESYLDCLQKIQGSITFFQENNPKSLELEELVNLFDDGAEALKMEFRNLLYRHSKPVAPIAILDMLGMDDEMPTANEERLSLPQLSDDVQHDLTKISEWLQAHKIGEFITVYSGIRSNILIRSVQGLKDHLKNSSGNSNTLTVPSSPQLGPRRSVAKDSTPRRPKKIQQLFVKKATSVFAKYSPSVESAMLGHRFQSSLLSEPKDEVMENDVISFMTTISGLLKLMQSEQNLMHGVIPANKRNEVFETIVTQSMENFAMDGDAIVTKVKKNVTKHEFASSLNLFPILRHMISIKADFDKLFQGCTPALIDKLRAFTIKVEATLSFALDEFVEGIKNDPDTKMPKDGTVHQLTSNAIMMLEQLQDYQDILATVLVLQDKSFMAMKDRGKLAFAQYITRVLSALGVTLQTKSDYYSDVYLRAIFRMNNLNYIAKALRRTGLLEIVQLHNPVAISYYEDQIRDQKRVYSKSWSRVLHFVMEVDKPISQQRAVNTVQAPTSNLKLRDKDKQNIKDKFTGFNKEIDELTRSQKSYAVPDLDLRECLKKDNKEFILPKYKIFYEKYISAGFTKNIDKYIKYTPTDISNLIDNFFDAAA